jgi:hypothetical protein
MKAEIVMLTMFVLAAGMLLPVVVDAVDYESLCSDGSNATYTGTAGDDQFRGTTADDVLFGGGGNDHIIGDRGNDIICAGEGHHELHGREGNDVIVTHYDSSSRVHGGNGFDKCYISPDDEPISCEEIIYLQNMEIEPAPSIGMIRIVLDKQIYALTDDIVVSGTIDPFERNVRYIATITDSVGSEIDSFRVSPNQISPDDGVFNFVRGTSDDRYKSPGEYTITIAGGGISGTAIFNLTFPAITVETDKSAYLIGEDIIITGDLTERFSDESIVDVRVVEERTGNTFVNVKVPLGATDTMFTTTIPITTERFWEEAERWLVKVDFKNIEAESPVFTVNFPDRPNAAVLTDIAVVNADGTPVSGPIMTGNEYALTATFTNNSPFALRPAIIIDLPNGLIPTEGTALGLGDDTIDPFETRKATSINAFKALEAGEYTFVLQPFDVEHDRAPVGPRVTFSFTVVGEEFFSEASNFDLTQRVAALEEMVASLEQRLAHLESLLAVSR